MAMYAGSAKQNYTAYGYAINALVMDAVSVMSSCTDITQLQSIRPDVCFEMHIAATLESTAQATAFELKYLHSSWLCTSSTQHHTVHAAQSCFTDDAETDISYCMVTYVNLCCSKMYTPRSAKHKSNASDLITYAV
eukprot:13623-Heterococcus_DN1.PRE.6